jgi:hypothetical protein
MSMARRPLRVEVRVMAPALMPESSTCTMQRVPLT